MSAKERKYWVSYTLRYCVKARNENDAESIAAGYLDESIENDNVRDDARVDIVPARKPSKKLKAEAMNLAHTLASLRLKGCPRDASATPEGVGMMCSEESKNGYLCTRKKGHDGEHHAHTRTSCCETWGGKKRKGVKR